MKVITIGRSEECSIIINDVKVSRVHAQLVQDDEGKVSVVDLGSTNGTWVNGNRIVGEMRLNPNDKICIGDTQLPWQTYINNTPSQQVQPEISHSAASTTVLEGSYNAPVEPPVKKPQHNTLLIVVIVVLGLLVTGGVVWLLLSRDSKPSVTTDTIRITDTIKNEDYVNYLKGLLDERDSALRRQPSPPPPQKKIDTLALFTKKINDAGWKKIATLYRALSQRANLLPIVKSNSETDSLNAESWRNEIINKYKNSNSEIKKIIFDTVENRLGKIAP